MKKASKFSPKFLYTLSLYSYCFAQSLYALNNKVMMMTKRTFKEAFNAVFHNEKAFDEFCSLDVAEQVSTFNIGDRQVFRASDHFRRYLRFIDKVISRYLAKEEGVVHSFTKGKNTYTAVEAHIGNKYFFLTDIKQFYPNVKTDDVRRVFTRDKDLIPISDLSLYIDMLVNMTTFSGSIPVGFSTSPQLSNAFLFEFDHALKSHCDGNNLVYTRYADDIIISGKSVEELSDLKNLVQNLLHQYASSNLKLNNEKTHITHLGNKVKILGLNILPNGKITLDTKYKNRLELLLHFYVNNKEKFKILLDEEFGGSERSLFGLLHYANSIDPDYLKKLQRKYGAYALHSLMEERWNDPR